MCERKSLRPQGLARMTAEGARGCAWRAAGRRCRGHRHADVSRHRTQPYRTILCLTLQQEHTAKHILPCLSQRKPGGKKAAVENRRKCGKLCGKRVENLLQGAQAAAGGQPDGYFRPGAVWRGRSGGQERCARAWMRWGRRRSWRRPGAAEHGAVPTGGMCGCGLARAFGRAQSGACFGGRGCGGRFWLARCSGRAVRDAGAAQGALAGFLAERKNA